MLVVPEIGFDIIPAYSNLDKRNIIVLTLNPLNKSSSAKFLICFNNVRIGQNVLWVSNSIDPVETPNYSASHPDPSGLHLAL